jgi:signal peptidase II
MTKWRLLLLVFGISIVADQATKFLAVDRLTHAFEAAGAFTAGDRAAAFFRLEHLEPYADPPVYVLRPVWRMNYVENPAAAFGLFRGVPDRLRYPLFVAVTILAVAFVLGAYRKLGTSQRWEQVALALILAGALGNFADRLARGYVIDFIEWYWWNRPDLRWPTFNVADSSLVVGVAMLLLQPKRKAAGERAGERAAVRSRPGAAGDSG